MIPEFPKFKPIELSDKEDVEKITKKFPPYSDFNFVSMWSWNINNKVMLSRLNNNLIVLFSDYVSGENFLSFIGDSKVTETASELISFSIKKYGKNFLKLIPEELFFYFKNSNFIIKTERDSFDYIYLVENLANMRNWVQNTAGKRIRRFIKTQPKYTVQHSVVNEISHYQHHEMFHQWAESKNIKNHFELNEYKAFKRLLGIPNKNLRFMSIFDNETMIGFTLYEIMPNNYAISHFAKANKKHHSAIYDLLNWEEAKRLHSLGIKHFNWEQDLGMPNLRYSKIKYNPAFYLKKFTVSTS